MGTVIAVTSGKGGTGKSSLTAGAGSCLAALGHKTLCVDLDVGLRNLDISLGMSDQALMDFTDVLSGRCSLKWAAAAHPDIPGLSLLSAPVFISKLGRDYPDLEALLDEARREYEYILLDCPAGLGGGFQAAVRSADRALVVATTDPAALRDAQRTVQELSRRISQLHLIVNRVQPSLLRRLRTTIDSAMDQTGLPLLGVVPEDPAVVLAANSGRALILHSHKGAAVACLNISKRLAGQKVPLMKIR